MSIEKLKVHFVHLSSGPGGIEVLLPRVIRELSDISFSALVIRPKDEISVYDNVPISIEYGSRNNLLTALKIFSYGIKHRKDIFHVFNIGPFFLLALKLAGVRNLVYSIHGTVYWKEDHKKQLLLFLWKLAFSRRFAFTANSEYSRSVFINKILPGARVRLLYNPIDAVNFPVSDNTFIGDPIRIMYAGRLNPGKNLPLWINIAQSVHQNLPSTRFDIYGVGPLEQSLNEQISAAGAQDYIKLRGFRKDIEKAYQESDLLLFLSEFESFGNVVVESILCGTPVLASPIPAMTEIFSDHACFLLHGTSENWTGEICEKIRNIGQLKAETQNARRSFAQKFSMKKHTDAIREIYETESD